MRGQFEWISYSCATALFKSLIYSFTDGYEHPRPQARCGHPCFGQTDIRKCVLFLINRDNVS